MVVCQRQVQLARSCSLGHQEVENREKLAELKAMLFVCQDKVRKVLNRLFGACNVKRRDTSDVTVQAVTSYCSRMQDLCFVVSFFQRLKTLFLDVMKLAHENSRPSYTGLPSCIPLSGRRWVQKCFVPILLSTCVRVRSEFH